MEEKTLLHHTQLTKSFIFPFSKLGANVGRTHSRQGIFFRVGYVVGIMTLDETTVLACDRNKLSRHDRIECRSVQVGTNFSHHEAGPYVAEIVLLKAVLQAIKETFKDVHVGQAAMYFFCTYFISDAGKVIFFPEVLRVYDQLNSTIGHHVDVGSEE